jgi:tRNA U34 5-methylaminomethyl-2-thiouridine-forming methyltransferase MnmC
MEENGLFITQDGSHSIHSAQHGVSYHSKYGAIQESRHVFLSAGLFPKLINQQGARVLEVGLGTGLNALLTRLEAEQRRQLIQYTALEAFPIGIDQAIQLNYPQVLGINREDFIELHTSEWAQPHDFSPYFQFTKLQQRFEDMAFDRVFDLVYFDAFAPTAQPELWVPALLEKVVCAMAPGAIFVTYCAKGSVKRALKSLGLDVEALQGPPGKREMTRARKPEQ